MDDPGPIRYEVTARVPLDAAAAYERYLREEHIPDLIATGCFVEAEFSRTGDLDGGAGGTSPQGSRPEARAALTPRMATPPTASPPAVTFRSAYLAPDRAALDRYLSEHAPRLRAHALERFSAGLTFSRAVWSVLERWGGEGSAP